MPNWHVLYTKPHAERQVDGALRARGIETFLPQLAVASPRPGRSAFQPYFPCYLFAYFDLEALGVSKIIYTPGLRHLVTFGERVATVEPRVIERVRAELALPRTFDQRGQWLRPGDAVEILEEPFREMEAVFDRHLTPEGRVRVFLTYLEQHNVEKRIPLDIALHAIRKSDDRRESFAASGARRRRSRRHSKSSGGAGARNGT